MNFLQALANSLVNTAASLMPFAPLIAICLVTEKFWATYKVKNTEIAVNIAYTLMALAVVHGFILPAFYQLNRYIPHNIPTTQTSSLSPSQKIGYWLIYLMIFDFLYYCFHRAQHTFSWMWRYHMVHHVDENISSTAFAKHHWLEDIWRYSFITIPILVIFDTSQGVPYLVTAIVAVLAIFMHWNTPLKFGFLEKIIITPHYHRIHHSIERRHYNKNFGAIFQIWDHLFKTRHVPIKGEFPKTGVQGVGNRNFYTLLLPIPLYREERESRADAKMDTGTK